MKRITRGEKRYFRSLGLYDKQLKEIVSRYPLLGNKIITEAIGYDNGRYSSSLKEFNKRVTDIKKIILTDLF